MSQNKTKDKPKESVSVLAKRKKDSFVDFCYMTPDEIMAKFATLPGAQRVGQGEKSFVYVPPTREKSVLLVAHCDTVWGTRPLKIGLKDENVYHSLNDQGIGADDRAGITMLWKLRNLGHALLVPNAEEIGCVGSKFLMEHEEWRKKLNTHLFAIEMDRMNDSDLAFYGIATEPFKDWCEKEFKGYKRVHGSWTDICVLCDEDIHKEDCLDGVNISVGYYGQHGKGETLKINEWQRTLSCLHKVLSQKELPSFRHKYVKYTPVTRVIDHRTSRGSHFTYPISSTPYSGMSRNTGGNGVSLADESDLMVMDSILVCPKCESIFDESEYRQNNSCCIYCGESCSTR